MKDKRLMQLLVGSEAIFFLSLIVAYLYFRQNFPFGFKAENMLDIKKTGIFSALLFSSSFTFWMAERSFKKSLQAGLKIWLVATLILGFVFLAGQAHEYYSLLFKKNLWVNSSEFGSNFYTLTGFHGLHVLVGLICLSILLILSFKGDFKTGESTAINSIGIYWHFVDAVWAVVFTIVYVLPHLT